MCTTSLELMGEQTESVGITIEVGDVCPLFRSELVLILNALIFKEVGGYGTFAGMSKRGVSEIVSQTGG